MRRRFGRGRRRGAGDASRTEPIDAAAWFERLGEVARLELTDIAHENLEELPDHYAVVGHASRAGLDVLVGFSPQSGGDAALAVLGHALRQPELPAEIVAISTHFSGADRRRLALFDALPTAFRAVEVPELADPETGVAAEPDLLAIPVRPEQLGARVRPGERELLRRGIAALGGLAAKHGGAVRTSSAGVELLVLAQRAALISFSGGRARLETPPPDRSQSELTSDGLATALDRLEGLLRKRLNDRRVRSGEEGLRAALLSVLGRALDTEVTRPWPLQTHPEREIIDLIGTDAAGRCFVAAARESLGVAALGEVLDAAQVLRPLLPLLLGPGARIDGEPPSLVLAAQRFDELTLAAASGLAGPVQLFEAGSHRSGGHTLEARAPWERATAPPPARATEPPEQAPPAAFEREAPPSPAAAQDASAPADAGIEEISLFDLDDEGRGEDESDSGRRRRRGRRRGRRGRGRAAGTGERSDAAERSAAQAGDEEKRAEPDEPVEPAGPADDAMAPESSDDDALLVDDDDEAGVAPLAADAPDLDEEDVPGYDEEEDEDEGDGDDDREADRARRERELRRRARAAKAEEPETAPRPVRRRAAFVACADRPSILTALVLARDQRLVEGFWIYPQTDLMTFFRSIATDLREDTPIHVVGFSAAPPARDTIQAAALYRGRLDWYDHHDWPPEDLLALRGALGEDRVHFCPGAESSLPAVLSLRTRRSRFSDKLVELMTGRFTQHDYERWGRLWWHRLGELAKRPGERRSDIDPLLVGRPSELARRAAEIPIPEAPPEVSYVASRDFRLVHFGGFVMVVLDVPQELDLHLASRVARERYEAQISLAHRPGDSLLVLGGDEGPARRGLDLGAMTAHLAAKLDWIESLPDDDNVARMRVRDLWSSPSRMDEVVAEIAMGRSIVEG